MDYTLSNSITKLSLKKKKKKSVWGGLQRMSYLLKKYYMEINAIHDVELLSKIAFVDIVKM